MKLSIKRFSIFVNLLIVSSMLLAGCSAGAGASKSSNDAKFAVYALNSEPLTNWDPAAEFSNGIHVHE